MLISNQCVQDLSKDPPSTSPRNSLKDLELYAPEGSGVRVTNSTPTACRITARLTVATDAPIGVVKLWLIDKKTRIPRETVDFTVAGITAGPIPPGLNNKGQVDVMWSVLPDQVVHDNFGASVATEYFCIDAVIGNDSGYDIQIASIGFTLPSLSANNPKGPQYRVPNTGYRVVRGTLQRREQMSPRNLILNGIKVAGPLLTGFTPFFHNAVHATNFSELINIISNPLEKGFELAVPDTVPFQVNRLSDQTFRDDVSTRTVIPNNIQTRITTFVPKEILFPGSKGGFFKRRKAAPMVKVPGFGEFDRSHPQDVMRLLGDIVIIGEQIEHVNRIRVVSTGLEAPRTDTSVSGKVTDACNQGVGGVTMTISAASDFTSREVSTSPDGTYSFPNVPVGRTYTVAPDLEHMTFHLSSPGSETFTLNDSKTNLNFGADYVILHIAGKVTDKDGKGIDGATVKITGEQIKGHEPEPVTTTDTGEFSFDLSVSDSKIQLPTAKFKVLGVSSGKATFDSSAEKTWDCNNRNVDLKAAKPTPAATPKPSPSP